MLYFWIRVYDYNYERDNSEKGILLDEYYLKDINTRELAKETVKNRYYGNTKETLLFSKPKRKNGLYAIVMESNKFFYDRFYLKIDTYCFYCHKKIQGRACEFPKMNFSNNISEYINSKAVDEDTVYFCNYNCKYELINSINNEGEFQEKEVGNMGVVFGYIYLMYNRAEDKYYIGQTRYLPFFRWQEHIKAGEKGKITDISFSVISEVRRKNNTDDLLNQEYLNNIEAWWIAKYREEGYEVYNISNPRLTLKDYIKKYEEMITKKHQLAMNI